MKRVLAFLLTIVIMCFFVSCSKEGTANGHGLQMSGSYLDNIADFKSTQDHVEMDDGTQSPSGVAKAYLQAVTYEIKELDEDSNVATLEVCIPNFAQVLPQIITKAIAENEGSSYEELMEIVRIEMEAALLDENIATTTEEITLPVEEADGKYVLVYNEQWEQAVFGNLQELYLESYRAMLGGVRDETAD